MIKALYKSVYCLPFQTLMSVLVTATKNNRGQKNVARTGDPGVASSSSSSSRSASFKPEVVTIDDEEKHLAETE